SGERQPSPPRLHRVRRDQRRCLCSGGGPVPGRHGTPRLQHPCSRGDVLRRLPLVQHHRITPTRQISIPDLSTEEVTCQSKRSPQRRLARQSPAMSTHSPLGPTAPPFCTTATSLKSLQRSTASAYPSATRTRRVEARSAS